MSLRVIVFVLLLLSTQAQAETGIASVDYGEVTRYDSQNYHYKVATGARFNPRIYAVAHRNLPLESCVEVKYRARTIRAIVNDRGPCASNYCQRTAPTSVKRRILDMTPAAAQALAFPGIGMVEIRPMQCL